MEKFTKKPQKTAQTDRTDTTDHYYQNQTKFDNNIYFSNQSQQQTPKLTNPNLMNTNQTKSSYRQSAANLAHGSTFTYDLTPSASTDSSRKELLYAHKKEATVSFLFLLSAILFLTLSILLTIITFIFPFWIELSFRSLPQNDPNTLINITNKYSNVTLISTNRTDDEFILFNLGIWEVKMHQELEFYDQMTRLSYKNNYPQSLLWLGSDINNQVQSFLIKLLDFIHLQNVNIFTIQILEILHLIFTFLTLCFTSFTLCLCTTHKSALCWYLVCFLMCLVAFFTGLVVIILIVVWQLSPIGTLLYDNQQPVVLTKYYNWCFWFSVAENLSILIAAIMILLYILLTTFILFNHDKARKRKALNNPFISDTGKLPRYAPDLNVTKPSTSLSPAHQNRMLQTMQNMDTMHNPSYIFYTGYGNYRKASIDLEQIKPEFELTDNGNLMNYSFVSQNKLNQSHEHNYSNVEHAQNDFRFTSYK